ncbi:MAG: hypothetical protein ACT4OJ_05240 [Bacteroidota bacterium]
MSQLAGRKLAVLVLLAASAAGAFATLGDGRKKASTTPNRSLLSGRTAPGSGFFNLKSGYTYRGSQVINSNTDKKYISLNTVVTVHKGSNTYLLPLKKKAVLDRVKIDLSNRQFKRN